MLRRALLITIALAGIQASASTAPDRFCDPSFEDCRAPLLTLIANERIGIDRLADRQQDHGEQDEGRARLELRDIDTTATTGADSH